ncbi:MAG: hypothetical protein AB7T17_08780 [Geobacter sp.]
MSLSSLFNRLGAPLHNSRWSWGAVRANDGSVFLRVWQDESKVINGKRFMRITANEYFQNNDPNNLGYQERLKHIQQIQTGAKSYMIVCVAQDITAIPRAIINFNSDEVFEGGELISSEGDMWLEFGKRIPIHRVRA